ncbi:TIR domain-containing protein [Cryptosporangium sp. NPDC051539]|uniref:TIR domain-containing protein n=1 Tax=Cryptosporangium sp. NPDC051539 TaxID=3363962 RepID=UPI0037A6109A
MIRRYRRRSQPPSLFICYRHEEAGHASAFADAAVRRYGQRRVFRDRDALEVGENWPARLDEELERAAVVVAIIGPDWTRGSGSGSHIRDDNDIVRYELRTVEARKNPEVRILPLTVRRATLPTVDDLPPDLHWLPDRQATEVQEGNERRSYSDALKSADRDLGRWARQSYRLGALLVVLLLLICAVLTVVRWPSPQPPKLVAFADSEASILIVPPMVRSPDLRSAGDIARTFADNLTSALGKSVTRSLSEIPKSKVSIGKLAIEVADEYYAIRQSGSSRDDAIRYLLNRSHAQIMITGTLDVSRNNAAFAPEAFFGSYVRDAEELAAERIDAAAEPISVSYDIHGTADGSGPLAEQAGSALSWTGILLSALTAYQRRQLEDAAGLLGTLLDAKALAGGSLPVLHHLRGNAWAGIDRFDNAEKEYRAALEADPGYERSTLGLADLDLLRNGDRCGPTSADLGLLDKAQQLDDLVRRETMNPRIRLMAAIGSARVDLCRVRALSGPAADHIAYRAQRALDDVLSGKPLDTVREPLATARLTRARLAMTRLSLGAPETPGGAESDDKTARTAAEDLNSVPELTNRPWLKADAQHYLALLRERYPALGSALDARHQECADLAETLRLHPGTYITTLTTNRMNRAGC